MQDGEHGVGGAAHVPIGGLADELFQPQGVAARPLDDGADLPVRQPEPQHGTDERGRRVTIQATEGQLARPTPSRKDRSAALGPREPEHAQRSVGEAAQRGSDEPQRGRIGPVQILEDEEQQPRADLGGDPVQPRSGDRVGEDGRIVPGRWCARVVVRQRHTQQRPERRGRRAGTFLDEAAAQSRPQAARGHRGPFSLSHAAGRAQGLGDGTERRPGPHGIGAGLPDGERLGRPARAAKDLVTQARLAEPGRGDHQDRGRAAT